MSTLEAILMGLLQGLTEYLPVSSSGHLTIAAEMFGVEAEDNLTFTIAVHVATVLSTLVVLWNEVTWIFKGLFTWNGHINRQQDYALNIIVSMIPVGIVGVFFKDWVEDIFGAGLFVVGCCLLFTASLLTFSYYARPRSREKISRSNAFVIGLAQAVAVLPGVSRSGSTIATGLMLGNKKEVLAQFSFLMVIPPILGEALLDIIKGAGSVGADIDIIPLVAGFVTAFISGCLACRWMINLVKRGKLIWFGVYCAIVGTLLIIFS